MKRFLFLFFVYFLIFFSAHAESEFEYEYEIHIPNTVFTLKDGYAYSDDGSSFTNLPSVVIKFGYNEGYPIQESDISCNLPHEITATGFSNGNGFFHIEFLDFKMQIWTHSFTFEIQKTFIWDSGSKTTTPFLSNGNHYEVKKDGIQYPIFDSNHSSSTPQEDPSWGLTISDFSYTLKINVEECDSCDSGSCSEDEMGSTNNGTNQNSSSPYTQGSPQQTLGTGSGHFRLSLPKTLPSSIDISSSSNFYYAGSSLYNEERIKDTDNKIRQIKNDKGLTWVKEIEDNAYEVVQYDISKVGAKDVDGFYTISGNPDTKLTFEKDVASPHILKVKEEKGGNTVSNVSFEYNDSDDYWKLGRDNDGDGNFESFEYTDETFISENKVSSFHKYDGGNELVYKVQKTYDANDNLVESIIDPGGSSENITRYTYDEDNNQTRVDYPDGSWESTNYNFNGEPELINYSSGGFIKYEYDGTILIKKIESFNGSEESLNENEHKVTTYDYTPVVTGDDGSISSTEARIISVALFGNPISKTFYGYLSGETVTIQAATPTSTINDAANLISRTFTNAEGEVVKEINPDGTGTIIDRTDDGTTSTVTTDTGVLSGDNNSIISGTSTVEISENDLEVSSTVSDIATGFLISSRTVTLRDSRDRESHVDYHDGTYETYAYNCCNLDTVTSRDGIATSFTYDGLDREETSMTNGVTRKSIYDAQGNIVEIQEIGIDLTVRTISKSHYNLQGDLEWTEDGEGNRTTYSKSFSGTNSIETITYPNLKTRVTTTDSNGRLLSVSGTGTFHEGADLDNEFVVNDAELGYAVHVQQYGKLDNWTKTYTDALGRVYKTETSTGAVSKEYFDSVGNLVKSISASGATTLYHNDLVQNISIQALDVNQNGTIDYGIGSTDVITRNQSDYIEENSVVYQRTRSWINADSLASPGAEDNLRMVSNDGLFIVNTSTANGISSTLKVITEIDVDGSITTTSVAPDGSYTKTRVVSGLQDYIESYDANDALKSRIDYGYDNFNRLETQTDSRNGTTTYVYDNNDRVTSLTTSDPDGTGPKTAQTFQTFYTNMGQRDYVVHPNNSQINFSYTDQGLIETATGSQVYPRTYGYDAKGNLTALTTTGNTGDSTLTWEYYSNGQLHKKKDARNREVTYTYYPDGRLRSKSNSLGTITWVYDTSGRLEKIICSDDTPTVTFGYNNLGRLNSVSDALGDRSLIYNELGQFTGNSWLSGVLSGLEQSYTYDSNGRQQTAGFEINGITRINTYLYNSFGLLEQVDDGANKYNYSYLDQSPYTVEHLEIEQDGTVQIHSKREFDKLMRTTGFEWKTGAKE